MVRSIAGDAALEDDIPLDFDPLAELDFTRSDQEEMDATTLADGPYGLPNPDAQPSFKKGLVAFDASDSAEERIAALFGQMPTLHAILYDMLASCTAPVAKDELEAHVAELKSTHHCVYSPVTFCDLLERAGALSKVTEDGTSLADFEQEPLEVEIDGVLYWQVAPAPPVFWQTTGEGAAKLAEHDPARSIRECLAENPDYERIFVSIMEAARNGASLRELAALVDDDPAAQSPRRYAAYFVDKLERAGAVSWNGAWRLSGSGEDYLASLAERSADVPVNR